MRIGAAAAACTALLLAGCAASSEPATTAARPSSRTPATWNDVGLVNNLADVSAVSVYTRPIRIDDPDAAKAGLEPPYSWREYLHRLERGNEYVMTPWAGRYEIAFTPVGHPVSDAIARGSFEVPPGSHLVVSVAGLADAGRARVVVGDGRAGRAPRGKGLVRAWNLLAGSAPLHVDVAEAPRPYASCGPPASGWVTIARAIRFGEVSESVPLTPGTYRVRVRAAGATVATGFLEAPQARPDPGKPRIGELFVTALGAEGDLHPKIVQERYPYGVTAASNCD